MTNQYKIVISNRNIYKEVELPVDAKNYRIGTSIECDYRLHKELFFEDVRLDFTNDNGIWQILCSDNLYLSFGDSRRLITTTLKHGDLGLIKYQESNNDAFSIEFTVDFDNKKRNFERKIEVNGIDRISIGSGTENNIVIHSEYIKEDKIELIKVKNHFELQIKNVTYDIYHNGNKALNGEIISEGDFFSVSDVMFYFKDNCIWTEADSNSAMNRLTYKDNKLESKYPLFVRNTRLKSNIDEESIKILDPASIPTKPQLNIVTSLMPTLMMFALVVVLRGFMSTSGGTYIIFSICSMGLGVVTTILNIVNSQNKYKKDCKKRIDTYEVYIEKKKNEIETERNKELESLKNTYYSTAEDLEHILEYNACLFDRLPEDKDFLDVYLGVGRRKASKKIDYKEQEKLEIGDQLTKIPEELADKYEYIENAPMTISLKEANAIGIIGQQQTLYDMFLCFVIDIISRQYQGDVKLYAFLDDTVEGYEWIRLLPHFQQENFSRNIICDNQSRNYIFESLYKELAMRSEIKEVAGYNVVLIMNERGIKNHPISRFIEDASNLNTVFIFFEKDEKLLPLHCSKIIKVNADGTGETYSSENKTEIDEFRYEKVSKEQLYKVYQMLAPSFCDEISLEGTMRKNITLYELLKVYSAQDINLQEQWSHSKIYETMAVPIGVNAKDEIVYLNLHEKFHGPHGLVAGTTGSGKSEILQAFILSAATIFHPYEIGFVIIDFKGGGMVNQFKDLPHLIGAITNIDGNEIQRSLKSIKAELVKRQSYFAQAGVNHIDKYIKLFKEGKVSEALPHLVIIVDEFAELKAEQPDFMKELISAARIGRSLGVHLILATQKPSGVVDAQIWSNSKFKLCLKVQSKEDSNEVLKTPLAAEIKEPGRAYLQVGNNEIFELFQSAYSGAPSVADLDGNEREFSINQVNFAGARNVIYKRTKQNRPDESNNSQLEAIVEYISTYCKKSNLKRLPNICMPPLPKVLNYQEQVEQAMEMIRISVGLYDDPEHQLQNPYMMNITSNNYMIIGSAQTGKTNILQTIIRGLAEKYSSDEVNMYIIDFGSMILRNFADLKHVGGVVCSYEDEKLKSLFRLLNQEISARKLALAEIGVSSFAAYKEAGMKELPQIVIFIDNLTALKELYLQENDILLPLCRDGIAVGISFIIANAQTAGIGYRYLSNFEGRIATFCNETSEYSMLFEGCRLKLPNVAGRSLIQIEKNVYECQAYISFEGEKEYERVQEIKKFITLNKEKWKQAQGAKPIPEIPDVLSYEYFEMNYPSYLEKNKITLGLNFESVMPVVQAINEHKFLAIAGKKDSYKDKFANRMIQKIIEKEENVDLYILDDLQGKWSEYELHEDTVFYAQTCDVVESAISEMGQRLVTRYENVMNRTIRDLEKEPLLVLIIENNDVIDEISKNKNLMPIMKDILEKYYEMRVFVLFSNIENAAISFNASELLKLIKNTKNYLVFDDVSNIKLTDISVSYVRKHAKQIEKNDAFYIHEGEISKLKVII